MVAILPTFVSNVLLRVLIDFVWNNAAVDPTRCYTREKAGNERANIFVANGVIVSFVCARLIRVFSAPALAPVKLLEP